MVARRWVLPQTGQTPPEGDRSTDIIFLYYLCRSLYDRIFAVLFFPDFFSILSLDGRNKIIGGIWIGNKFGFAAVEWRRINLHTLGTCFHLAAIGSRHVFRRSVGRFFFYSCVIVRTIHTWLTRCWNAGVWVLMAPLLSRSECSAKSDRAFHGGW